MHRVFAPSRMAAIEQPQVPVRIALAVAEPFAQKTVSTRHFVGAEAASAAASNGWLAPARAKRAHRRPGRAPSQFAACATAKSSAVRIPVHGCSMTSAPQLRRNFCGIIATARVDDDGLRRKPNRAKALGEAGAGVAGDHHQGQGKRGSGSDIASNVRAPRIFAHPRRGSPSVATVRPECAAYSTFKPGRDPARRQPTVEPRPAIGSGAHVLRTRDEQRVDRAPIVARRYRARVAGGATTSGTTAPA